MQSSLEDNDRIFIWAMTKKWAYDDSIQEVWDTPGAYIIISLAEMVEDGVMNNTVAKRIVSKLGSTLKEIKDATENL